MSTSFSISGAPPEARDVFAGLGVDVRCFEREDLAGTWPEGTLHFYRPDLSCRSVEVTRGEARTEVRILACSSPEDVELGLAFVETFSRLAGSDPTPEGGAPVSRGEFRAKYGAEWARSQAESSLKRLQAAIAERGETVSFQGATRQFFAGPELIRRLDATGDFFKSFFDAVRRVQHLDAYPANALPVSPPGEEPCAVAVVVEGVDVLLPPVEWIALQSDSRELFVPVPFFSGIAAGHFEPLDEKQALVRKFEGGEWTELLERARAWSPPRRPWWKFW